MSFVLRCCKYTHYFLYFLNFNIIFYIPPAGGSRVGGAPYAGCACHLRRSRCVFSPPQQRVKSDFSRS